MKTSLLSENAWKNCDKNIIARHYLNAPEDKLSPPVQANFQSWVNHLYTQLKKSQIKDVRVPGQPYASAAELLADFQENSAYFTLRADLSSSGVCLPRIFSRNSKASVI